MKVLTYAAFNMLGKRFSTWGRDPQGGRKSFLRGVAKLFYKIFFQIAKHFIISKSLRTTTIANIMREGYI